MNESVLRKWHRSLDILLMLFIILQAGSGLLISLGELSVPHGHAHEDSYAYTHENDENHSGKNAWNSSTTAPAPRGPFTGF